MARSQQPVAIHAESVPRFAPHVRLHQDRARARYVVMAPERMLVADDVAAAILARVDGVKSVAAICADLAATFAAPADVVQRDTISLLQDMADKLLITT